MVCSVVILVRATGYDATGAAITLAWRGNSEFVVIAGRLGGQAAFAVLKNDAITAERERPATPDQRKCLLRFGGKLVNLDGGDAAQRWASGRAWGGFRCRTEEACQEEGKQYNECAQSMHGWTGNTLKRKFNRGRTCCVAALLRSCKLFWNLLRVVCYFTFSGRMPYFLSTA